VAKAAKKWWKLSKKDAAWRSATVVSVDKLRPDPANPNEMEQQQIDMLREDIIKHGFDEPLQVAPVEDEPGVFLIVGGEHRWKAAKAAGLKAIPVVVHEEYMEAVPRREAMIRRNENRGRHNPEKLRRVVLELRKERKISVAAEAKALGFSHVDDLRKIVEEREERSKKAAKEPPQRPPVVNNLDYAIRNILAVQGDSIPKGYIFFCYKDRFHLMVQMEAGLQECVKHLVDSCEAGEIEINDRLEKALRAHFQAESEKESP